MSKSEHRQKMTVPLVSVVIPVYNAESYLEKALESLRQQSFQDFEIVAVNDHSSDNSLRILQRFAHCTSMTIISNSDNLGVARTLNIGISNARGKYIARFDADDICHPERLEKQVNFLEENPEIAVLGTEAYIINSTGAVVSKWEEPTSSEHDAIYQYLIYDNCLFHPSIMMSRCVAVKNPYNPSQKYEDYDLWLNLANQGYRFHRLKEPLIYYRVHSNQITHENGIEKIPSLKRVVLFFNYLRSVRIREFIHPFNRQIALSFFKQLCTFISKVIKRTAFRIVFPIVYECLWIKTQIELKKHKELSFLIITDAKNVPRSDMGLFSIILDLMIEPYTITVINKDRVCVNDPGNDIVRDRSIFFSKSYSKTLQPMYRAIIAAIVRKYCIKRVINLHSRLFYSVLSSLPQATSRFDILFISDQRFQKENAAHSDHIDRTFVTDNKARERLLSHDQHRSIDTVSLIPLTKDALLESIMGVVTEKCNAA